MIRSRLGVGAMGEVYYAEDSKLERPVALKRVAHRLRDDPDARHHILHEAQRSCQLTSEHIAGIYDVVEESDELFMVMEYVEGTTLRRRLQDAGRLPLEDFLQIALQCADALAEAQNKGIVHHDLKPENIMLTAAGHVKILDFGLARRVATADTTTASLQSGGPFCGGTPGYMAPEVLLQQASDGRSDIFSLGVVFYEMLSGQNPFQTGNPVTSSDRILHHEPLPLRKLVAEVPPEVERIVSRMLAKDPGERYAAAELVADLRALPPDSTSLAASVTRRWTGKLRGIGIATAAIALVILLLAGVFRQANFSLRRPTLPEKKFLAVLPFDVAEQDPNSSAFCRGLTETLAARLTQLGDRYNLQVISPSEIRKLAIASPQQARAGLGVNLVLEGSFHKSGSRVRVIYDLVDTSTRRVLRADTITADSSDPFDIEDRVVRSAMRAFDMELGAKERQELSTRGTTQPAAYDFYLRGRGYLLEYQKPENIESAIQVFRRALDLDPEFALALAGLGESYWQKYELTQNSEWVARAQETCQRASAGGSGYECLGRIYNGTGKYEEAATEFERALSANPLSQDVYRGLAFAYEHLGKTADAEQAYNRAISVHPEYWGGYNWLGSFFYRQARYQEAARMFAQVTELAPDNVRGYNNLGGVYVAMGRYADAIPVLQRSVTIAPNEGGYSNLGTAYFYSRRFSDAAGAYEQAVKLNEHSRTLWGNLGDAY